MGFDNIPQIVSAYKCKKCGNLFENTGKPGVAKKLMDEHFRISVVELPGGYVFRRYNDYLILGNSEKIDTQHNSVHTIYEFDVKKRNFTDEFRLDIHAGNIITNFSIGFFVFRLSNRSAYFDLTDVLGNRGL